MYKKIQDGLETGRTSIYELQLQKLLPYCYSQAKYNQASSYETRNYYPGDLVKQRTPYPFSELLIMGRDNELPSIPDTPHANGKMEFNSSPLYFISDKGLAVERIVITNEYAYTLPFNVTDKISVPEVNFNERSYPPHTSTMAISKVRPGFTTVRDAFSIRKSYGLFTPPVIGDTGAVSFSFDQFATEHSGYVKVTYNDISYYAFVLRDSEQRPLLPLMLLVDTDDGVITGKSGKILPLAINARLVPDELRAAHTAIGNGKKVFCGVIINNHLCAGKSTLQDLNEIGCVRPRNAVLTIRNGAQQITPALSLWAYRSADPAHDTYGLSQETDTRISRLSNSIEDLRRSLGEVRSQSESSATATVGEVSTTLISVSKQNPITQETIDQVLLPERLLEQTKLAGADSTADIALDMYGRIIGESDKPSGFYRSSAQLGYYGMSLFSRPKLKTKKMNPQTEQECHAYRVKENPKDRILTNTSSTDVIVKDIGLRLHILPYTSVERGLYLGVIQKTNTHYIFKKKNNRVLEEGEQPVIITISDGKLGLLCNPLLMDIYIHAALFALAELNIPAFVDRASFYDVLTDEFKQSAVLSTPLVAGKGPTEHKKHIFGYLSRTLFLELFRYHNVLVNKAVVTRADVHSFISKEYPATASYTGHNVNKNFVNCQEVPFLDEDVMLTDYTYFVPLRVAILDIAERSILISVQSTIDRIDINQNHTHSLQLIQQNLPT